MARKPQTPEEEQNPEPIKEPEEGSQPDSPIPEGVIRAPTPRSANGTRLLLAQIMRSGEPTVMMLVPANMILTLDDHTQVAIKAGPQDIPARLANHWYLAACGVKRI